MNEFETMAKKQEEIEELKREIKRINKKKRVYWEKRVYLVEVGTEHNNDDVRDDTDEEIFMQIAEEQGNVYSLEGFAQDLNLSEINTENYWVRII